MITPSYSANEKGTGFRPVFLLLCIIVLGFEAPTCPWLFGYSSVAAHHTRCGMFLEQGRSRLEWTFNCKAYGAVGAGFFLE